MGVVRVLCRDVGCVWERGVGVKLGHRRSKQSSSSKAHSTEEMIRLKLLLC